MLGHCIPTINATAAFIGSISLLMVLPSFGEPVICHFRPKTLSDIVGNAANDIVKRHPFGNNRRVRVIGHHPMIPQDQPVFFIPQHKPIRHCIDSLQQPLMSATRTFLCLTLFSYIHDHTIPDDRAVSAGMRTA